MKDLIEKNERNNNTRKREESSSLFEAGGSWLKLS